MKKILSLVLVGILTVTAVFAYEPKTKYATINKWGTLEYKENDDRHFYLDIEDDDTFRMEDLYLLSLSMNRMCYELSKMEGGDYKKYLKEAVERIPFVTKNNFLTITEDEFSKKIEDFKKKCIRKNSCIDLRSYHSTFGDSTY